MAAYRELAPPPGLEQQVACVWVGGGGATRVLPDACVDIVWTRGELVVAGPATMPDLAPATPGQSRCGVRFRVGMAGSALGLPASELLDQVVPLTEIWGAAGRRLEGRVAAAERPLEALIAGVAGRISGARDDLAREAVLRVRRRRDERRAPGARERVERAPAAAPLRARRSATGRARCAACCGSSASSRPRRSGGSLARLAADAGYADQAHLARECRRLAGLTPSALLAEGAGPAGEPVERLSDPFKPERRARCDPALMTDISAAHRFVTLHARLIDRRRLAGDPALIRSALAAYQNPDGGFAYLEPDLPDAAQPAHRRPRCARDPARDRCPARTIRS